MSRRLVAVGSAMGLFLNLLVACVDGVTPNCADPNVVCGSGPIDASTDARIEAAANDGATDGNTNDGASSADADASEADAGDAEGGG